MDRREEALRRLSAVEYIEAVASHGRANIEPEMRESAWQLYSFVDQSLTHETSLNASARATYHVIRDVLFAEHFLSENSKLRYIHYTNLRVLDRYLLTEQAAPAESKWYAAKRALALIVRDWHNLEQDRLSAYAVNGPAGDLLGFEDPTVTGDRIAHLRERERALRSLSQFAAVADLPDTRIVSTKIRQHNSDWEYFANDADLQISHLLCLPQTRWHDEVMFLKTIHATECCYSGILASLSILPHIALRGDWGAATEILKTSLFFSDFLIKLWTIFDTMPVAHFFDGFREATGDASAIQSVRFQTLEALARGLGERKRRALSVQREAGLFAGWYPPKESTLNGLYELAHDSGGGASEFRDVADMLDRDLYQWRSRHYGIARRYLPVEAVGTGNEGVSYLAENFREPRFRFRAGAPPIQGFDGPPADADEHSPVRATSTLRVGRRGSPPITAIECKNISAEAIADLITSSQSSLARTIKEREGLIRRNLDGYRQFFNPLAYPVERQLNNFRKSNSLPKALAPALLLSIELRSASLMGLHDATRVAGRVTFDTASADESFSSISGGLIRCSRDEPVIRDEKEIIASVFQGPDRRTAIQMEVAPVHRHWYLFVIGFPGMPMSDFRISVTDAGAALRDLKVSEIKTWVVHEY